MNRKTLLLAFVVSMNNSLASSAEPSQSAFDPLKIAVQKICPVSGKSLGSMGTPSKVRVGEEEIFLCCKGCAKGQIKKEHWTTIHANFAKAQGSCPVMEKPLPASPKWTFVDGQIVYICCPPCTKKIQAEPAKYLSKVAGYYKTSLQGAPPTPVASRLAQATALPANRDQLKAAIQAICPVSGNRLDFTGKLNKVKAGDIDLFLCCEGCKEGKVNQDHWSTIQKNIARAQAVCPVMEKSLPEKPTAAVVEGQLVFVCCPPCTKKIQQDPKQFLGKIDDYYMASLKQSKKAPIKR